MRQKGAEVSQCPCFPVYLSVLNWLEMESALGVPWKSILGTSGGPDPAGMGMDVCSCSLLSAPWFLFPRVALSWLQLLITGIKVQEKSLPYFSSLSQNPRFETEISEMALKSVLCDPFSWVTFRNCSGFRRSLSRGNGVCRKLVSWLIKITAGHPSPRTLRPALQPKISAP